MPRDPSLEREDGARTGQHRRSMARCHETVAGCSLQALCIFSFTYPLMSPGMGGEFFVSADRRVLADRQALILALKPVNPRGSIYWHEPKGGPDRWVFPQRASPPSDGMSQKQYASFVPGAPAIWQAFAKLPLTICLLTILVVENTLIFTKVTEFQIFSVEMIWARQLLGRQDMVAGRVRANKANG